MLLLSPWPFNPSVLHHPPSARPSIITLVIVVVAGAVDIDVDVDVVQLECDAG